MFNAVICETVFTPTVPAVVVATVMFALAPTIRNIGAVVAPVVVTTAAATAAVPRNCPERIYASIAASKAAAIVFAVLPVTELT